MGLKDSKEEHDTDLWCCHSDIQSADGMTKRANGVPNPVILGCDEMEVGAQQEMLTDGNESPRRHVRLSKSRNTGFMVAS